MRRGLEGFRVLARVRRKFLPNVKQETTFRGALRHKRQVGARQTIKCFFGVRTDRIDDTRRLRVVCHAL